MEKKKTNKAILILIPVIIIAVIIIIVFVSGLGAPSTTNGIQTSYELINKSKLNVEGFELSAFDALMGGVMILNYYGYGLDTLELFVVEPIVRGDIGALNIVMGLNEIDMLDKMMMGLSKEYNLAYLVRYALYLGHAEEIMALEEQVITMEEYEIEVLKLITNKVTIFENSTQALNKLKELIRNDTPVIALIDHGKKYVVVTGYDKDNIYVNDPEPGMSERTITINDFINEWDVSEQSTDEDEIFPSDYGMIWFTR